MALDSAPAIGDDISFGLLQAADVEAMIHLIGSVFSAAEPPAVAMGLSVADFSEFLNLFAARAVEDGLTVIARSDVRDKVVGALLTHDFAMPAPLDLHRLNPRFLPILAMLDSLDDQYRSARGIRAGEYLHLLMLAVDPQSAGRGIAQRLVEHCLANGTRKGYRWAVTEATGVISQRVFGKLGFEERSRVRYRDFRYRDAAVFAGITQHDGAALMDRALP
jgi:ribosomal protein S18 acetylase RimI-like enzyme